MAKKRNQAPRLPEGRASGMFCCRAEQSEDTPSALRLQARFIAQRFDVSLTIACVVAELAFGATRIAHQLIPTLIGDHQKINSSGILILVLDPAVHQCCDRVSRRRLDGHVTPIVLLLPIPKEIIGVWGKHLAYKQANGLQIGHFSTRSMSPVSGQPARSDRFRWP